ncbi:HesB/IscA family protein [Merismopedia glauca]|uniref:Iron-sulfur cluster assembly accessory protein n=1 Tax=Merismopedia glauca CCAP 1448/3 TaxID=1296344 RepID=A0A2T1BYF9_9CYAN|nr:iron-sulfur cluster assembly accessory protein [Merismopedia glauca]PSB01049.1 iron-sulfur cluster assembly accessory protein [Merismopedia glauca CCAP 1448/3]
MIQLSQIAIKEIKRLHSKPRNSGQNLRLGVKPGGCGDFLYVLSFDSILNPDDITYESDGITVAVDSQSLNYIDGLTLDYSEDLMGGNFRFHNPNAASSCGCGISFVVNQ